MGYDPALAHKMLSPGTGLIFYGTFILLSLNNQTYNKINHQFIDKMYSYHAVQYLIMT